MLAVFCGHCNCCCVRRYGHYLLWHYVSTPLALLLSDQCSMVLTAKHATHLPTNKHRHDE